MRGFRAVCGRLDNVRTFQARQRKKQSQNAKDRRSRRKVLLRLQELWETRDPQYLEMVDLFNELLARDEEREAVAV
jgi:hypothetical protein